MFFCKIGFTIWSRHDFHFDFRLTSLIVYVLLWNPIKTACNFKILLVSQLVERSSSERTTLC